MHHRAKHSFEIVRWARYWHDNSMLGYEGIARLLSDVYQTKIGTSTVRDWINETRGGDEFLRLLSGIELDVIQSNMIEGEYLHCIAKRLSTSQEAVRQAKESALNKLMPKHGD